MVRSTEFTVVIPTRYGSTRLPGKPLIDLNGKPMIQHVAERALASNASRVIIATDDQRIVDAAVMEGVEVIRSEQEFQSGTDRVWDAISYIDWSRDDIIVNVQGDEPLLPQVAINQAAALVRDHEACGVATLYEPMPTMNDVFDANQVKVVIDKQNRALYFSRAPIPWERGKFDSARATGDASGWYRHVGIYAFRYWALERFVSLPRSRLEELESLEQLRWLENGVSIAIDESLVPIPAGVDTREDVDRVRALLAGVATPN